MFRYFEESHLQISTKEFLPKAYDNDAFLHSAQARTLRILAEYLEPQTRLRLQKIRSTIVFFGSARAVPADELDEHLDVMATFFREKGIPEKEMDVRLNRVRELSAYYDEAVLLSKKLAKHYHEQPDPRDRHCICSGAGPGMMEAANRGAFEANCKTIGLSISLPFEQGVNRYLDPRLTFEFHYFFMRKYWFVYLARALVIFPGGFGTMDELFEVLTLVQTRKIRRKLPIVLYGANYWTAVMNIPKMVEWGVISDDDLKLFKICDTVDEAFEHLTAEIELANIPAKPAPEQMTQETDETPAPVSDGE
jgi:uncharacterized protein (TIGR00730 family)